MNFLLTGYTFRQLRPCVQLATVHGVLLSLFASLALTVTAQKPVDVIVGLGEGGGGWIEKKKDLPGLSHAGWPKTTWESYNTSSGETHPAAGDLDGDGWDEIALGLDQNGEGFIEILDDERFGYRHLEWIRVNWASYNNSNGETWPAIGNLDSDPAEELVIGLSAPDGKGWMEVRDDHFNNYSSVKWMRVKWSPYNSDQGKTLPAVGDVTGDGEGEIIVGLGERGNGWFEIFAGASGSFGHLTWQRLGWTAYNQASGKGEVRPAAGDVDGDGTDEIVTGTQTFTSSGGWVQVRDDGASNYSHLKWIHGGWDAYNSNDGQTRPVVGDMDQDGNAEILLSLGAAGNGWLEVREDQTEGFAHESWTRVKWDGYNSENGETYSALPEKQKKILTLDPPEPPLPPEPPVPGTSKFKNQLVATSGDHCLALDIAEDAVWVWGEESWGELGNGTPAADVASPVRILSGEGVVSVAAGINHSLFLLSDGTVLASGANPNGQLGANEMLNFGGGIAGSATPVQVQRRDGSPLDNIVGIWADGNSSYALGASGTVWVWGNHFNYADGLDRLDNDLDGDVDEATDGVDNDGNGFTDDRRESEDLFFAVPFIQADVQGNVQFPPQNVRYIDPQGPSFLTFDQTVFVPGSGRGFMTDSNGNRLSDVSYVEGGAFFIRSNQRVWGEKFQTERIGFHNLTPANLTNTIDDDGDGLFDEKDEALMDGFPDSDPAKIFDENGVQLENILRLESTGLRVYALSSSGTVLAWGDPLENNQILYEGDTSIPWAKWWDGNGSLQSLEEWRVRPIATGEGPRQEDGIDNDRDGLIDEIHEPVPAYNDGINNDFDIKNADAWIDEMSNDGIDNDVDGRVDEDPEEGADEDGDGLIDEDDPEGDGVADGGDNDGDGRVDEDMETDFDDNNDGIIDNDPINDFDDDGDGIKDNDPINSQDNDGDGRYDEEKGTEFTMTGSPGLYPDEILIDGQGNPLQRVFDLDANSGVIEPKRWVIAVKTDGTVLVWGKGQPFLPFDGQDNNGNGLTDERGESDVFNRVDDDGDGQVDEKGESNVSYRLIEVQDSNGNPLDLDD